MRSAGCFGCVSDCSSTGWEIMDAGEYKYDTIHVDCGRCINSIMQHMEIHIFIDICGVQNK